MADMVGKLVEDKITAADADVVIGELGRLRSALRSNEDGGGPSSA
jgi:hypothetical protein